jgi:hypothetical protein
LDWSQGEFVPGKPPEFPEIQRFDGEKSAHHGQEPFGVMADPDDDGPKYQQNWQHCWVILSENRLK